MSAGRLQGGLVLLALALALLLPARESLAVDVVRLGHLMAGDTFGYGVTASGLIVGESEDNLGRSLAFIWTPDGGMLALANTLGGVDSVARGVSADGSLVVGYANTGAADHAVYWDTAGVLHDIHDGALALNSDAYAISSDGKVIVGEYQDLASRSQSYYWTSILGMVKINPVAGDTESSACAVNSDGTVIVGDSGTAASGIAYRWTASSGIATSLGVIDAFGGTSASIANGVSADGSVVVGSSTSATTLFAAYRWTQETGMVDLGSLGGFWSEALAVSDDGEIVVGYSMNGDAESEGFIWTGLGMRSVNAMLADAGVDMNGLTIEECSDISGDGSTIVGTGLDASGAYATYLIRETGITTPDALNRSLSELSAVASDISYMAMGTMRGLMDQADHLPAPGSVRFWLTGSLLGDASLPGKDKGGEGGIGITADFASGLTLGTGLFLGRRSVDTKYGGSQVSSMFGPGVYLSYAPEPYGWRFKLGALYERASLELDRGYPNGGGTSVARGATDGDVFSLSGHLGWVHPLTNTLSVQPYLEYDLQTMILDAYTETDTPFPVHYNQRRSVMNKTRLGAELRSSPRDDLDLWGWAAWSHRYEDKGPSMDGYLVGLNDFSFDGGTIDKDWGEIGAGLKYRPVGGVSLYSRMTIAVGNDHYAAPDAALTSGISWEF